MSRFSALVSPSPARAGVAAAPLFAARAPIAQVQPAQDLIEVVGHIEQIRVFGDWAVGSIWSEDRSNVKIKGDMVKELKEGQYYRLSGRMRHHDKYGESLEVMSFAPHVKNDPRAIAKFMVQNFDGIGPKSADKMVRHAIRSADARNWRSCACSCSMSPGKWTGPRPSAKASSTPRLMRPPRPSSSATSPLAWAPSPA